MFEHILSTLKAFGKDILFLAVGIVIGLLLSNVLKSHYRNECMEKIRVVNVLEDYITVSNVDTIERLCGKSK